MAGAMEAIPIVAGELVHAASPIQRGTALDALAGHLDTVVVGSRDHFKGAQATELGEIASRARGLATPSLVAGFSFGRSGAAPAATDTASGVRELLSDLGTRLKPLREQLERRIGKIDTGDGMLVTDNVDRARWGTPGPTFTSSGGSWFDDLF